MTLNQIPKQSLLQGVHGYTWGTRVHKFSHTAKAQVIFQNSRQETLVQAEWQVQQAIPRALVTPKWSLNHLVPTSPTQLLIHKRSDDGLSPERAPRNRLLHSQPGPRVRRTSQQPWTSLERQEPWIVQRHGSMRAWALLRFLTSRLLSLNGKCLHISTGQDLS